MRFLFASPTPARSHYDSIQGKVVYLLILIALVQFSHPITPWARSFANLEMISGVLYVTIIMARLVGLYAQEADKIAMNQ